MRFHRWRIAALTLALGGCQSLQHNDVMIFATDTKVAFDVSASAVNGGSPELTLGYKRGEAVWMPLLVNGRASIPVSGVRACDETGRNCQVFVPPSLQHAFDACLKSPSTPPERCLAALNSELKYQGSVKDGGRDAYSVFASFGADFAGRDGGRAALAQFFATGLAAQNLASRPDIGKALKVDTPDAGALDDAKARAEAAERLALEAIGAKAMQGAIDERLKAIGHIRSCMSSRPTEFKAAVAAAQTAGKGDFSYFNTTVDSANSVKIDELLMDSITLRSALEEIATNTCG